MRVIQNGAFLPTVAICCPTFDARSTRAAEWISAVNEHTTISYRTVIGDCEGALLGYTRPMNAAMSAAIETGKHVPYLVAMNDDVHVTPGWLEMLLDPLIHELDVWCVTPDARHTDGPQVYHPWCMAWRTEAWQTIGGLDEQFVIWGSDIDLARRLVDAGHPPLKVPLPFPLAHALNATSQEHPELGPIAVADLDRFVQKWGVTAESEKYRLAALVA